MVGPLALTFGITVKVFCGTLVTCPVLGLKCGLNTKLHDTLPLAYGPVILIAYCDVTGGDTLTGWKNELGLLYVVDDANVRFFIVIVDAFEKESII